MDPILWILLGLALLIVAGLAAYAGWLHLRLHRHRRVQKANDAAWRQQNAAHEDYLIDSIRILARNMVEEDLNLSEGAIRLKHLLDGLGLSEPEREQFRPIDALYGCVCEFDTHDARQALSPKERFRQDQERERHEREHREAVLTVAGWLINYRFQDVGSDAESTAVRRS